MNGRTLRTLALGIAIGGLGAIVMPAAVTMAWSRHDGSLPRVIAIARPAQGMPINPHEFVPVPDQPGNNPAQAPFPGTGSQQNCDRVLFYYQGRLYQLRPGPMPRGGGNPEFFTMQPYEGPQIPGFPQMPPGSGPDPSQLPVLKF